MDTEVLELTAVLPQPRTALVAPHETVLASDLLSAHMDGIDVLRGAAVLAVVVFHGMAYKAPVVEWGGALPNFLYGLTAWGWLGVNLFFVISGFLITGILDDTLRRQNFYERFYLRRALRILPAYVAVLLLAWATGFVTPNYMVVCMLFLANMPGLFLRHGYLFYGPFWSLAVEEQFYLLWPMMYRKLRRRGMLAASLAQLVICPVLRALSFGHLLHTGDALSKTWMIGDNLAIGAFLAIFLRWPGITVAKVAALGWTQLAVGVVGLVCLFGAGRMGAEDVLRNSVGLSCFLLICSSAVVGMLCLFRKRAVPGWLRGMVFLGKISYGLYLIHLLLLQIYDRNFGKGFEHDRGLLIVRFLVANGVAVVAAMASRRWFEDPILRLKGRIAAAG
ncbi:acyltransferase family protein [Granulicella aggregans]|uniref:acyltransferase family protein n=1 Tax=Granulicella aggregans TaxID=474949 RepID=UPI0021E05C68|nr:acyltransferase [Granulicella aggregans]